MNDALGAAGRAHRILFEDLGYEYIEINLANQAAHEQLNGVVQYGSVELVYSAVGMWAGLGGKTGDGEEVNFWEANRVPYISLSGDSPVYYFVRHIMPSPWHACLYVYPEHLELRRRLGKTPTISGLVPPIPIDLTDKRDIDFRKKESGKLLFLKNGNDPEKLIQIWRESVPPATFIALTDLAGDLVNSITTDIGCDIDALVTKYFLAKGWDISEWRNHRLFFDAQLDDYLRRVKSVMIADVLADFPVEIHGFNWDHFDFSRRRATFVPGGDYTRSRANIVDALGLVDMSPNTQLAPHDRPMRAFGLCTLCVTNEQRFFTDNFANADMFSYRFEKDDLSAKIADVVSHPKRYVELGLEVAEHFRRDRHPHDLAQFMLDTASHIRLANGPRPAGLQDFFIWPPS